MTKGATVFDPDWVVSPGEILREVLEDTHMSPRVFGVGCGRMPEELVQRILDGKQRITQDIAVGLRMGSGISERIWLRLEDAYRRGLAAGKKPL